MSALCQKQTFRYRPGSNRNPRIDTTLITAGRWCWTRSSGFQSRRNLRRAARNDILRFHRQPLSNGDSVVVEFADDLLEEVNGLFAVVVPQVDRNTHAVNIASNYFARQHFADTDDLIGMQRVGEALDAQWREFFWHDGGFS